MILYIFFISYSLFGLFLKKNIGQLKRKLSGKEFVLETNLG